MYKKKSVAYLFILPFILFVGIFLLYPFIKNIINSFYQYESVLDRTGIFIGINNYLELFKEDFFQKSLRNTFVLIALVIVFQVGIALVLALMVSSIKRCSTFFKVAFFMPIVISATALGLMFNLFYNYDYGMFNQILAVFNLDKVFWMDPEHLVRRFIFVVSPVIWQYIGFYFVIYLTGLMNICPDLLEAAEIDGCSGLKQVWYIKIPLLRNVTSTILVLAITGTLKVFDLPYIISPNGYPDGNTHFLGTYMYHVSFGAPDVGASSAFAVFIVILGVVLSMLANRLFRQSKDY